MMINKAWEGITSALYLSVVECDFDRVKTVPVESVVDEIVSLGNIMGLEVDNDDID